MKATRRKCFKARYVLFSIATIALQASFLLLLSGCGYVEAYRRGKQVGTYARLQVISANVQSAVDAGEPVTEELLHRVIEEEGGLDTWGNEYRFATRKSGATDSWIIVSLGSDGRCDVSDIHQYFDADRETVSYQFARDIVFRDGQPLKSAGK